MLMAKSLIQHGLDKPWDFKDLSNLNSQNIKENFFIFSPSHINGGTTLRTGWLTTERSPNK